MAISLGETTLLELTDEGPEAYMNPNEDQPVTVRVIADVPCMVAVGTGGVKQTWVLTFAAVAINTDAVTIDDGVNTPVTFTFGDGSGGTVNKGVSATASAQNLKTAIVAATLAVDVSGDANALTIRNENYEGGFLTHLDHDTDSDYALTSFSALLAGTIVFAAQADLTLDTVRIFDGVTAVVFTFGDGTGGTVNRGASATDSAQNLKTAINASALNVDAAGAGTTLTITNAETSAPGSIGFKISHVESVVGVAPDAVADDEAMYVPADTAIYLSIGAGNDVTILGTEAGNAWVTEYKEVL